MLRLIPYGTSLTSSILEVYLKYAKYAYLGQESILQVYLFVPPPKYILRPDPSILQVYFKYTWNEPKNILGPYLEKYVISTYFSQVYFKNFSPSTLLAVFN